LEIPFNRWYPAITTRHSRRQYDPNLEIPPDVLSKLYYACEEFRPFPEARVEMVSHSSKNVFRGIVGSYGKVKNAPAYLAFIGDTSKPHFQESAGYCSEGIILEATALGLATCWVAGFFRPGAVAQEIEISSNEKVLAVSPLGYSNEFKTLEEKLMSNFARSHERKPLSQLVEDPQEEKWPKWVNPALEAACLAPSASNRQPWKFKVEHRFILVSTRGRSPDIVVSKRLDCGIAMLHLEVAALSHGIRGKWELLDDPLVARFNW